VDDVNNWLCSPVAQRLVYERYRVEREERKEKEEKERRGEEDSERMLWTSMTKKGAFRRRTRRMIQRRS
jgi:hypothetical protein